MARNSALIAKLSDAPEIICQSITQPDKDQDDSEEETEEKKVSNG